MHELVIDGEIYEVDYVRLFRVAEYKDKYGIILTEDGVAQRELVGVYINYQLNIAFEADVEEYNRLWRALVKEKAFHTVTILDHKGPDYTFEAWFENVSDEFMVQHGGRNYFKGLTVNFMARSPAYE